MTPPELVAEYLSDESHTLASVAAMAGVCIQTASNWLRAAGVRQHRGPGRRAGPTGRPSRAQTAWISAAGCPRAVTSAELRRLVLAAVRVGAAIQGAPKAADGVPCETTVTPEVRDAFDRLTTDGNRAAAVRALIGKKRRCRK